MISSRTTDFAAAEAVLRPGDVLVELKNRLVTKVEFSNQNKIARLLRRVWRDGDSRFVVVDISKSH